MMLKRSFLVLVIFVAIAGTQASARMYPTRELENVLATLRNLSSSSFQQVVWWAPKQTTPSISVPDWNRAEREIMELDYSDRHAVLSWLNGRGRHALYDRGATDEMIGPPRFGIDSHTRPSNPPPSHEYRILQLTSEKLRGGEPPASGITVNSGFALIKKDATKAIVCLSFTNVKPVAATSIKFAFVLVDDTGDTVGTLDFTRTGTFSANIAINGPANADDYLNPGFSSRGAFENCMTSNQGTAALPLIQTRFVTYKVLGVKYADGTTWP